MIYAVGDAHGNTEAFDAICARLHREDPGCSVFHVGDMGVGFDGVREPQCGPDDFWISGNHDDHKLCLGMPGYLGDFGVRLFHGQKVFWLRGAFSVDKEPSEVIYGSRAWKGRTEGVDWWPYEELSMEELSQAIDLYENEKPDIVISHDCPNEVREEWFGVTPDGSSRTSHALSVMFRAHQPKVWAFGHWHSQQWGLVNNTMFVCCGELQSKRIWPPPVIKDKRKSSKT